MVEALDNLGLMEKIEDYTHAVPHHDRCGTVIEPMPMEQWFVAMRDLADLILPLMREKKIDYVPDRFREYSIEWLENIRDWCISRQLWWGHRIPVWTCENCGEVIVNAEPPEVCTACGSQQLTQDPGCARYVVFLGAVAFCNAGVARRYGGFEAVSPDGFDDYGTGYFVSVGDSDDYDGG